MKETQHQNPGSGAARGMEPCRLLSDDFVVEWQDYPFHGDAVCERGDDVENP